MASSPRLPLCILALNTGMRAGELLGLRWDAIDFDRKLIIVKRTFCQKQKIIKETTKTHSERFVSINEVVFNALLKIRRDSRSMEVFSPKVLDCNDITHLSRMFRMDCRKSRVREIRFHDLRHTFATQFVANGGSIFHL